MLLSKIRNRADSIVMLTNKQERFVQELVKGKSQREAYKIAYDTKASDKSVDELAARLFKNVKVRSRYDELITNARKATGKSAEEMRAFIIEQLGKIASGEICDITQEFDGTGNLLRQKRTVKASDVKNALDKLAEYHGVAVEQKEEITIVVNGGERYTV